MREKFRPGRHLVEDEESGLTVWDDQVTRTWDRQIVRKNWADTKHPQDYVPPQPIPARPYPVRADEPVTAYGDALEQMILTEASAFFVLENGTGVLLLEGTASIATYSSVVAGTNVPTKVGAASHLFDLTP